MKKQPSAQRDPWRRSKHLLGSHRARWSSCTFPFACLFALAVTTSADSEKTGHAAVVGEARSKLAAAERVHGDSALETAAALDALVSALTNAGAQKEAETLALAERAVRIKEKVLPPEDPRLEASLLALADLLKWNAQWERARLNYERLLTIRTSTRGDAHLDVALILDALGIVLRQMGRYEEAQLRLESSLRLREGALPPNDPAIATSLHLLGIVLHDQGDLERATACYERALAIRRDRLPADDPAIASTLSNLGAVETTRGRLTRARDLYEQALRIYERGDSDLKTAETLSNLGNVLKLTGDIEGARRCGERSRDIRRARLGESNPFYGSSLALLAEIAALTGDYPEALRLYDEVYRIWVSSYGENHVKVAFCLREQAILFDATGAHEEAGTKLRLALEILVAAVGREHHEVTYTLDWLAAHQARLEDYDGAESTLRSSMALRMTATPIDSLSLAWNWVDLADVLEHLGRDAEARLLYTHGLSALQRILGSDHYDVARVLYAHARHLMKAGEWDSAGSEFRLAKRILDSSVGTDSPMQVPLRIDLATVMAGLGHIEAAFDSALGADEAGRAHMELIVQGFPERRALGYTSERGSGLALAQALAVAHAERIRDATARTWDAWIRGRALVLDEVASRHRGFERNNDAEVEQLAADYRSIRQRVANLEVRGPGSIPIHEYRRLVETARAERENLEQRLAAKNVGFRREHARRQIGFDAVRSALPEASVLVAFVRCELRSPPKSAAVARRLAEIGIPADAFYVAFITRGDDALPSCVNLGSATALDDLIDAWRRQVKSGLVSPAGDGTPCRLAGEKLRRAIWDPIAEHLRDATRVFIVPDGSVQLVNFSALPIGGAFLIESGPRIHYLSAERDLVPAIDETRRNSGMLVLGNPDFAARSALRAHPEDALRVAPAGSVPPPDSSIDERKRSPPTRLRSACAMSDTTAFQPLERSGLEASELAELWDSVRPDTRQAHRDAAILLLGARATETAFKTMASRCRVLHLATHGFFIDEECIAASAGTRATSGLVFESNSSMPSLQENPLLHSGVVLAGADHRTTSGQDEEDGILTAEEIALLDLNGVEWVVLSACDTGLGAVVQGEGVFGLRRAFKIAGAGTLIMSLWPVREETTRVWMRAAYEARLRRHLSTDAAVHRATLETLRWCRQEVGSDHPGLWAGFIASGNWH